MLFNNLPSPICTCEFRNVARGKGDHSSWHFFAICAGVSVETPFMGSKWIRYSWFVQVTNNPIMSGNKTKFPIKGLDGLKIARPHFLISSYKSNNNASGLRRAAENKQISSLKKMLKLIRPGPLIVEAKKQLTDKNQVSRAQMENRNATRT